VCKERRRAAWPRVAALNVKAWESVMMEREDCKALETDLDDEEFCEIGLVSEETRGTIGMRPEGLSSQP